MKTVSETNIQEAISIIADLQQNADRLTDESITQEIKNASYNHGIAHGYIRCLRDLRLLQEPEYSRLFTRQLKIHEKISLLQEKRLSAVRMPESPITN